ncbi:ParA family protein [Pendulispora albinea]|uniref:ParA family protein n=1 Tax=Pendulispora albinea TaxID=2741071 RepID=A0ABZ2M997_9BACT
MAAMTESCSICTRRFDVQFRYQMEEREGGFSFFCSQACHDKQMRGEAAGGVVCKACGKRFSVELVSQVLRVRGERTYACSEPCRTQLLAEANGVRLGAMAAAEAAAAAAAVETAKAEAAAKAAEAAKTTEPAKSPTREKPAASAPKKPMRGPRRLAIFNHKGGTGKTTTSVSIAAGLAARGLRVLLVDTDSQGNVGVSLNVKATTSLYHVLVMGIRASDAAVNVRPNLDVLISNETLAAAELYLAGRQNRDRILRERLMAVEDGYDVVMLDCSPSLSLLNQNALVFADGILVPVACDYLSLVGVRQVLKTVKNVNSLLRHPVQIFGVLPTFYDARARICRDAVETLKEHFGERCLPPIRQTIKIKEAPAQGRTIYEYAPDSNAADDYKRIVDIIVDGADARRGSSTEAADDGELMATA